MKIILNNRAEEFPEEQMTINELIEKKNFTFKMLVTKQNNVLVKKDDRDSAIVKDDDTIDIIHLISGG